MKWVGFFLGLFFLVFPVTIFAQSNSECNQRYLTLVNPVRSRQLWSDPSLTPIEKQYQAIKNYNWPATWLLQDDTLSDPELLAVIKNFNSNQELGVFLEISKNLAQRSRVIYPYDAAWFYPNAVFLSGYSQSDRIKLIDNVFQNFKQKFGFYPKSVGAWWIDSYSLEYLRQKYDVKTAMIVADQKTTDSYGLWGAWWGVPYYPSKTNILTPASSNENKNGAVVIQWAQRDALDATGNGWQSSNHSLQANDYPDLGLDTNYFKSLVNSYLDCQNPLGQITIGLETGQEELESLDEYQNQLNYLSTSPNLEPVTMSQFAQKFALVYPGVINSAQIKRGDSIWQMNVSHRINNKYAENITYNQNLAFPDYFLADSSHFLNRQLPINNNLSYNSFLNFVPWLALILLAIASFKKGFINIYSFYLLTLMAGFGLLFRSGYQAGWLVFYGPKVEPLILWQLGLICALLVLSLFISKNKNLIWIWPLSFGLDFLVSLIRLTTLNGERYFGLATDNLHFVGLVIGKNLRFVSMDFPAYQAAALLKFNFDKIWNNLYLSFLVYPLIHLILAGLIMLILTKSPSFLKQIFLLGLVILLSFQLALIFHSDPRAISP